MNLRKLAFPGNATMLRLMGQHQYEEARRNQLKLPTLLRSAFKEASKPEMKAALIDKGMKESEIDSLEEMADNIVSQDIIQENAMKERTIEANRRIIALNLVWEKMSLVCQCAKLIFQDDAILYKLFLLYDDEKQIVESGDNLTDEENAD